ncbi:MAG: Jag N-terminal domain-containing protein [Elusimicrobia bacterium]|nr:Jag N-terminal domain-containing protein [Elusimicrobiota bacterium]
MKEIETQGRSVDEAIAKGLEQLGVEQQAVDITVVEKGSGGLFGLGARPARVVLRLRERVDGAPKKTERGSRPTASQPKAEMSQVDRTVAEQRVKEVIQTLLRFMHIEVSALTTRFEEDRVHVDVKSADGGLLIGREGQTLDALQLVVYLMVSRDPRSRVKVTVDVDGYRARAQERLVVEAQRMAAEVKRTGRAYHFRPMDADTRRVIHLALASDPDVETISEGEGTFRKVLLRPRKAGT